LWFAGPKDGIRGYLAIAGGIDVPLVLGSRSTYLRSRLGGIEGRALKAGDILHVLDHEAGPKPGMDRRYPAGVSGRALLPGRHPVYGHEHMVRVVLGPQDDRFTPDGVRTFLSSTYSVTPQSDRMGYRLAGPAIAHTAGPDIVSDGTPLGAVQVAGDGVPIVLMADRGTAGGYTKIATVISVDVYRLSQAAPGDVVRFQSISVGEAHRAVREQEAWLNGLVTADSRDDHRRGAAVAAAAVARLLSQQG
jgi:antagonist of KipI